MIYCPRCGKPLTDLERYGRLRRTCEACGFIHFRDPVVAVVVLIEQDARVLMVKRGVEPQMGKWAFPAGYVDYDEDPREAAMREVREETGLNVQIIRLIDVLGPDRSQGAKASIIILFEGEITGGLLSAQDDVSEAVFFERGKIPESDLAGFSSVRVMLERWLAQP